MNSAGNSTIRRTPAWMHGPRPIINSTLSAIAGAAVALGAVAAWGTYDTNSIANPSLSSSVTIGGGSTTGRSGHVDSDYTVGRGNAVTSDAIQPSAREPRLSTSGRSGHVDSEYTVGRGAAVTSDAIQPSAREPRLSAAGRTGHVDSDSGVFNGSVVAVAPAVERENVRGHVFSE